MFKLYINEIYIKLVFTSLDQTRLDHQTDIAISRAPMDREIYQAVRKEKIVTMETDPERLDELGNISVKAKISLNKTHRVQSTTNKPIEDKVNKVEGDVNEEATVQVGENTLEN